MHRLQLTAIPSLRSDQSAEVPLMEREGFVDERVVLALVAGPRQQRSVSAPGDLILPADDMDFAGWSLSDSLPQRSTQAPRPNTSPISTPFHESQDRRPAPPTLDEPGLGAPHQGTHRWWLAGLAGALSTLLFSLLLLSLSNRSRFDVDGMSPIPSPTARSAPPSPPKDPATNAVITDITPPK